MSVFLNYSIYYLQIVFEGMAGPGPKGDMALDDLSISYGNCRKILYQGKQH